MTSQYDQRRRRWTPVLGIRPEDPPERVAALISDLEARGVTPEQLEERLGLRPSNPFERYVSRPLARLGDALRDFMPDADPADVADMQAPGGLPTAVQAPFLSFLPRYFETGAPEPLQPAARVVRGVVSPGGIATLGLGGARAGAVSVGGSVAGAQAGSTFGPTGEMVGSMIGGVLPGARVAPRAVGILPGVPEEIVGGQAARTPRHVQDAIRAQELRELAAQAPSQGTLGDPGMAIPGTDVRAPRTPWQIDLARRDALIADIEAGAPSPFHAFEPGAESPEAMEVAFGRQRYVDAELVQDAYGIERAQPYREISDFERTYGRPEVHYPTRPEPDLPIVDEFGFDAYGPAAVQQSHQAFEAFLEDAYGPRPSLRPRATPPNFEAAYGTRTGRADISPLGDIEGALAGPGPIMRSTLEEIYGPYAGTPPPGAPRPTLRSLEETFYEIAGRQRPPEPVINDYPFPATGAPRAAAADVPPPPTPPPAATAAGATPPPPPVTPALHPEVDRSLRQAEAAAAQDRPGLITKGFLKVAPNLRQKTPAHILIAHDAEASTRAELTQQFFGSRMPLFRRIEELFGEGAVVEKTNVPFKGTPADAANPITGTFKDIADNPELYDLSPEQQKFLADFDARNTGLLGDVNKGYGAEIGQYAPKSGGAHLPNFDVSDDAVEAAEALYGKPVGARAVASGSSKERIYQTARDRMKDDPTFVPQTDVRELLRGMDQAKASAAAGKVVRAGVGGLDEAPIGSAQAHAYHYSDEIQKYLPAEEVQAVKRIRQQAPKTGMGRFMADFQATVLGGDFSPLFIQGMQKVIFHPAATATQIAKGQWAASPEQLAKLVRDDPQGWKDFAYATGRSLTEPTPGEFGVGFLGSAPPYIGRRVGGQAGQKVGEKIGRTIGEANTRMYNLVMALAKNDFVNEVRAQEARGRSHEEAIALAGDFIQRMIPTMKRTRYGLSEAQAQAWRVPLTSASFALKSRELVSDAMHGYGKIVAGGGLVGPKALKLTPRESLAVRRVTQAAAFVGTISVTSAVIEAQRTGQDPERAAKDALNPHSPRFLSLVAAGRRVPLGGPLRAMFQMIYPRRVSWSPVDVPFGGMVQYFNRRISPFPSAALEMVKNRDYRGRPIYRDNDNMALKLMEYAAESALPATLGEVASDIRTGDLSTETVVRAGGQFIGANIAPLRTVYDLRRDWEKDTAAYHELPSNAREAKDKKTPTRTQYRKDHPEVEAKLFIGGDIESLETGKARTIAVELMRANLIHMKDIRGFKVEGDYESDERRRLRRYFEEQLGEKPMAGSKDAEPYRIPVGSGR